MRRILGNLSPVLVDFLVEKGMHPNEIELAKGGGGYQTRHVNIKGKRRRLEIPIPPLKRVQRILLPVLQEFPFSRAATAGKGRGIRANASPHIGAMSYLQMDIKNCFQNTKQHKILFALNRENAPEWLVNGVKRFCIFADGHGYRLPTGAPTSPVLCDIALTPLDDQIQEIVDTFGYTYTRYVDDITISCPHDQDPEVYQMVTGLLRLEGYQLNTKKTTWGALGKDKIVITGISPGQDDIMVPREFRRMMRARLQNEAKLGVPWSQLDGKTKGYLSYIHLVSPADFHLYSEYYQKRLNYAAPGRTGSSTE